jgi:hypothetical protein
VDFAVKIFSQAFRLETGGRLLLAIGLPSSGIGLCFGPYHADFSRVRKQSSRIYYFGSISERAERKRLAGG